MVGYYRRSTPFASALSLRVFGEDITTAAREAAQKRHAIPEDQSEAGAVVSITAEEREEDMIEETE